MQYYQLEALDVRYQGQLIKIPLRQENLQTKDGAIQVQLTYKDSFKKAAHRVRQKDKVTRIKGDFYTFAPTEYQTC